MMSEMHCSTTIPDVPGLEPQKITVGQHVILNCEGSWDRNFDLSNAFVVTEEAQKNLFKIFKIEKNGDNALSVDMTFYTTGEIDFPDLQISDGVAKISLGANKFKIETVLAKSEDGQPPKPFGYSPSYLKWPWEYTASVVVVFILILLGIGIQIGRRARWRGLLKMLRNYDSPLAPDSQVYKNLRTAEKKDYPLTDIQVVIKTYILRRYQVPVFSISLRQTIKYVKSQYPRLKEQRRQMYNLLKDMESLEKLDTKTQSSSQATATVSLAERKKLIERFYRFIDLTEKAHAEGGLK